MVDMSKVTVLRTLEVDSPDKTASWFQTFLAVDRGVPSVVVSVGSARIVVADDNRAVRFILKPEKA
jgi:hypothetical protein